MNVTEQDVRDLIKRYPNPKNACVCSFAYHIPLTERNVEIINGMSKFIGAIAKRYRGPRFGRMGWNQDLPRRFAEKVSLYARNAEKYDAFFHPLIKPVVPPTVEYHNPMLEAKIEIARLKTQVETMKVHAIRVRSFLALNASHAHKVIILPEGAFNGALMEARNIISEKD